MALLLRFGADTDRLEQHDRPLIVTVAANRPDLIKLLLQAGADPNGRTSQFTNNGPVLMDAARMADSGPLRLLLRYGANPNLSNHSGETALFHAARWGRRTNVEALLAHGAHPESYGQQALDAAQKWDNGAGTEKDKAAIIRLLQKVGEKKPSR